MTQGCSKYTYYLLLATHCLLGTYYLVPTRLSNDRDVVRREGVQGLGSCHLWFSVPYRMNWSYLNHLSHAPF